MSFVVEEADTLLERFRKRVLFTTNIICILICVVPTISIFVGNVYGIFFPAGILMICIVSFVSLTHMVRTKALSSKSVEYQMYIYCIAVMLLDLDNKRHGATRLWPLFVVWMDVLLATRASKRASLNVMYAVVIYLTVESIDSMFTFGLEKLDAVHGSTVPLPCECSDYPCKIAPTFAIPGYLVNVVVFVLDFSFTRSFATQVERKSMQIENAVEVAEGVSGCLARLDLPQAELLLSDCKAGEVPVRLRLSLDCILNNLRMYKPYIPQACLPPPYEIIDIPDDADTTPVPPDVMPTTPVTPVTPVVTFMERSRTRRGSVLSRISAPTEMKEVRSNRSRSASVPSNTSTVVSARSIPKEFTQTFPQPLSLSVNSKVKRAKVTLVVTNLHDSFAMSEQPAVFEHAVTTMLEAATTAFPALLGVIDVFLGDRVFASFNGALPCARHAIAAMKATKNYLNLNPLHSNCAIATGTVVCGDMGCADMRRYIMCGATPTLLNGMERLGRAAGSTLVCCDISHRDATFEYSMRLLPRLLQARRYDDAPDGGMVERVWEVGHAHNPDDSPSHSVSGSEWMYEVGGYLSGPWAGYNKALGKYLDGAKVEDIMTEEYEDHVKAAIRSCLSRRVASQRPFTFCW